MIAEELFPTYRCETCTLAQKKERGCIGFKAPFAYWTDLDGELHGTCPRIPLMRDGSWFTAYLMYFNSYEKGFLPEPGGMNDQPAKFPEIMTTLGYALNTVREIKRKNEKPKR